MYSLDTDVCTTEAALEVVYNDEVQNTGRMIISPENALSWDNVTDTYGGQLSGDARIVYNELYQEYIVENNIQPRVSILLDNVDVADSDEGKIIISKEINSALTAFTNDYPEVCWVSGYTPTYNKVVINGVNKIVTTSILTSMDSNYGSTSADVVTAKSNMYNKVAEYTNLVEDNEENFRFLSDYDKAELLYTTMVNNITYAKDGELAAGFKDTAYGALVNGKCQCAGYARGFQLLCQKNGIRCIKITVPNHGLNLVKLEGKWYKADPTGDRFGTTNYFLKEWDPNTEYGSPAIWGSAGSGTAYAFGYPDVSEEPYNLLGDVDLNGIVTANDASEVLSYTLYSTDLSPRQLIRADVDKNGVITANDASLIFNMTLGVNNVNLNDIIINGAEVALSEENAEADTNGDGVFDLKDIVQLMTQKTAKGSNAVITAEKLKADYQIYIKGVNNKPVIKGELS